MHSIGSTDFHEMVKSTLFVDKTLFIEALYTSAAILITAARRLGKSTNLRMLQMFHQLEVTEDGTPLTEANLWDVNSVVNDTPNYQFFTKHDLKIMKSEHKIAQKYFGKFPVVSLDLWITQTIHSVQTVANRFIIALHREYPRHKYLLRSPKLTEVEKNYVANWLDTGKYQETYTTYDHFIDGCRKLIELLYRHFDKKVLVLIDEYDAYISKSLLTTHLSDENLEKISDRIAEFPANLFKDTIMNNYIHRCIMVGISSYIASLGTGTLSNVKTYKFLRNDQFVKFFGITSGELDGLVKKSKINQTLINQAIKYYDGYHCKNEKIFATWSIVGFLKSGVIGNYWTETELFLIFEEIFKANKDIFELVKRLTNNDTIQFTAINRITAQKMKRVRYILLTPEKQHVTSTDLDMVLTIFLEHGYISVIHQDGNQITGRIPNMEIKNYLASKFEGYYRDIKPAMNFANMQRCAKAPINKPRFH